MRLGVFLLFALPLIAEARLINQCGTYDAEGYYTEIESNLHHHKKKKVFILDRDSRSEITFYISNAKISRLIPDTHLGVNFKLKLKFTSSCYYHCEGEIVKVIGPLDPFESPKAFLFPHPLPIKGTEFDCQPNSFEDRQPNTKKESNPKTERHAFQR